MRCTKLPWGGGLAIQAIDPYFHSILQAPKFNVIHPRHFHHDPAKGPAEMLPFMLMGMICLLVLGLCSCGQTLAGEVGKTRKSELPALFSDHMVLQSESEVPIWGWCSSNMPVTVKASWGESVETMAGEDFEWNVTLHTPKAGGPHTLTIQTTDTTFTIQDVLLGEVWLAAGQSNMQMPLKGWGGNDTIMGGPQELAIADFPSIRMFVQRESYSAHPLRKQEGEWRILNPAHAKDFSAVAYFFAKHLHKTLKVPVGVMVAAVGSTEVQCWISGQRLRAGGHCLPVLNRLERTMERDSVAAWYARWPQRGMPPAEADWDSVDLGDMAFANPAFKDTLWREITLPARFDTLALGDFDGAVWLRKEFMLTQLPNQLELVIGAVDDMEQVFLNGTRVGGVTRLGHHAETRIIPLPRHLLRHGRNLIAIKAIDTHGLGLVHGPLVIKRKGQEVVSLEGSWKFQWAAEFKQGKVHVFDPKLDLSLRETIADVRFNDPTVPFNGMVNPMIPYKIRGVIWYQGEGNILNPKEYSALLPDLAKDWRLRWNANFPFLYVQITPHAYLPGPDSLNTAELRDAQRRALREIPRSGMVVTMDIGCEVTIHCPRKREVGERLARLALAMEYGYDSVATGPLLREAKIEGEKIIVSFDHAGGGLVAAEGVLRDFEIAGEDKAYIPANAGIFGNAVHVWNSEVRNPRYVRYGWSNWCIPSLFNKEGLPASSFSTEDEF
jgi:sialate O-acetylesterase